MVKVSQRHMRHENEILGMTLNVNVVNNSIQCIQWMSQYVSI